jgi:phage/conjugal plasmid C-4 type zinc finger TraR family protein
MDEIDQANRMADFFLQNSLDARVTFEGESLTECEDCGEEIPQMRREMIQGCTRCASCQGDFEARK